MIIDSARAALRTAIEDMITELEPLLDETQVRRVSESARFNDPFRPPPRPGERPPRGDRGPGDRPPPGGPPPPPN
jgi:hypothetical protein